MPRQTTLLFTFCLLIFLFFPQNYGQAVDTAEGTWIPNISIANEISRLFKLFLPLAGILATVMIMVGGLIWLTSAGNAERIGQAKGYISGAIIGLILALFSYSILYYINPNLVNLKPIWVYQVAKEENCFWNIANSTSEGDQWRACGGTGSKPADDKSCVAKDKPLNSAVCCCADQSASATFCASRGGYTLDYIKEDLYNRIVEEEGEKQEEQEKERQKKADELVKNANLKNLCIAYSIKNFLSYGCYYEDFQCCLPMNAMATISETIRNLPIMNLLSWTLPSVCPADIYSLNRVIESTLPCKPECIEGQQRCDRFKDPPQCTNQCIKEKQYCNWHPEYQCCDGLICTGANGGYCEEPPHN